MASSDDHSSPTDRHDELFKWVGICIKEWAKVEAHLFEVCHAVLKAERVQVAIIYYRTPTLDTRLTLADELLQTIVAATAPKERARKLRELAKVWKQLLADTRELLPTRNLLAHAPVHSVFHTEWEQSEGADEVEMVDSHWLEVATSEVERLRGRPARAIRDDQLPEHFNGVCAISQRLRDLVPRLQQMQRARRVPRKSRHR